MTETDKPQPLSGLEHPALDWDFLRRTAIATVVASVLVALFSAVYFSPLWAGRYVVCSLWAIMFFSLSALIFKYLLFEPNKPLGIVLIVLKIAALAGLYVAFTAWPIQDATRNLEVSGIITGITMPFIVLILRVIGRAFTARGQGPLPHLRDMPHAPEAGGSDSGVKELNSHP